MPRAADNLNLTLDKFVTREMLERVHEPEIGNNDFERDSDGSEVARLLMTAYIESPILPTQVNPVWLSQPKEE